MVTYWRDLMRINVYRMYVIFHVLKLQCDPRRNFFIAVCTQGVASKISLFAHKVIFSPTNGGCILCTLLYLVHNSQGIRAFAVPIICEGYSYYWWILKKWYCRNLVFSKNIYTCPLLFIFSSNFISIYSNNPSFVLLRLVSFWVQERSFKSISKKILYDYSL